MNLPVGFRHRVPLALMMPCVSTPPGETAIGKSTLIESLFDQPFPDVVCDHAQPAVGVQSYTTTLTEGGVVLTLTVIMSTGLGDQVCALFKSCKGRTERSP